MRLLAVVVLSWSSLSAAADYRDCRELYVSPLTAVVPDRKPNGAPWDNGSAVDVRISVKPVDRADLSPITIGPVKTDVVKPAWNALLLDAHSVGGWIPVRVGDSLQVVVTDQDAFADDPIDSFTVEVPKQLATNGVAFIAARGKAATVMLRIAASDGLKQCKGVDEKVPLTYEIPDGIVALPDSAAFDELAKYSRCNLNKGSDACRVESYLALHADLNEDKVPDILVAGGPFGGGTHAMMFVSLGYLPESRKTLFLGECSDLKPDKKERVFFCSDGERVTRIPFDGKPVREATQSEIDSSSNSFAERLASEARTNLKGVFQAQRSFFAEKERFSTFFDEIAFIPERENRYAYFLAARGDVDRRDGKSPKRTRISVIGPDEERYKNAGLPAGLKDANCPLTFGTNADGEPIGLGVTGVGKDQQFIAYAIGNVDDDADFDCWSVASFDRVTKSGTKVAAGEPFHEKSDYLAGESTSAPSAATPGVGDSNPEVEAIRSRYKDIGARQYKLRKVEKSIEGMSLEGTSLVGYFDKEVLRKAEWTFYGEGGQSRVELLFTPTGEAEFIFKKTFSGGTSGATWPDAEVRYYFRKRELFWATQGVDRLPFDLDSAAKEKADLLKLATDAVDVLRKPQPKVEFKDGQFR